MVARYRLVRLCGYSRLYQAARDRLRDHLDDTYTDGAAADSSSA